jgi:hypothetical protein
MRVGLHLLANCGHVWFFQIDVNFDEVVRELYSNNETSKARLKELQVQSVPFYIWLPELLIFQLASWLIDVGVFFLHTKGKTNSSSSLHNFHGD